EEQRRDQQQKRDQPRERGVLDDDEQQRAAYPARERGGDGRAEPLASSRDLLAVADRRERLPGPHRDRVRRVRDDGRAPHGEKRGEREDRAAAAERVTEAGEQSRRSQHQGRPRLDREVALHSARKDTSRS